MPKAPLPDFMNSRKLSMFFSQKFKYWVVPPPPGIITASNFFKTPPAISLVVMVRTLISGSRLTAATASQMQVCAPPCPLNTPNNCNNYPAPKLLRYPLSAAPPSPRGTVEVASFSQAAIYKRRTTTARAVVHRWSGKRDSNSRLQPWQGCALPTELFPHRGLQI